MGVYNAELLNNLGLCCFYAQQYDHTISCFERALSLSNDENIAEVWYNISHIAIVSNTVTGHFPSKRVCKFIFENSA